MVVGDLFLGAHTMNHRDRVRELFSKKKPDVPIVDLGGRVASLHKQAYLDLKAYLGFGESLVEEKVTFLNTISCFDERLLQRFDIPFRRVYLKPASSFQLSIASNGSFQDEWRVTYRPIGAYNERVGHPLANAGLEELDSFPWLDPDDPSRTEGLADEIHKLYNSTNYSLVAGHISAGIFQDCWNLRGMTQFLIDMVKNRRFAEALLDRVTEIHIRLWQNFLNVVGEYVDIVETADDLGGQKNLLISPAMYRNLIKPRHAALLNSIRSQTKARILYHSCGAILPLIEDLIEIGVDILNPIQPLPGLMDPETLCPRYGGQLIFHGGLDVQHLLPSATPEMVRQHVRRYLEEFGAERYIMAPANTIPAGTPPINIITAYDEALGFTKEG
jgi:uroporphyrinogen decarboxylase